MSNGLPLEVLAMISPILCWVERGESPGLPQAWHGTGYTFTERITAWLKRELPTFSYDNLEDIIGLAVDPRCGTRLTGTHRRTGMQSSGMVIPEGFNIVYMFHKLSEHFFQWTGNALCVKEERMVELHELAMRFPVRHLIRYCHADAVVRGYVSLERALEMPVQIGRLHTTYQSLRTVVERGLSEDHLHLNGVINADQSWADQMLKRITPGSKDGFTPAADRLQILSRTALRLLALGMLYAYMGVGCRKWLPFNLIHRLDRMYRAGNLLEDRQAREGMNKAFIKAFQQLVKNCKLNADHEADITWLLELSNPGLYRLRLRENRSISDTEQNEPVGVRHRIKLLERLHLTVQQFLVERNVRCTFVDPQLECCIPEWQINDTIKEKYKPIQHFIHQIFTRYIIYYTHHWQRATQSGKTTGLRNFQRYFTAQQRRFLDKGSVDWEGLAVEQLSQAKPLRSVEGRLSPLIRGAKDLTPWVVAFAHQAQKKELDKFGIVVHFWKKENKRMGRAGGLGAILDARHGKVRRLTQRNAFKLFRLLSTHNPVVPFIVGIDAANLELATPPEVFAPTFRFLREYPIEMRCCFNTREAFGKYKEVAELVKDRRLGMTYHVGEDFRHLLSGLRAIHEVIEFMKPLPGDRLGHAIALGMDPAVWASQVGYQSVIPKLEWLDTLVWVHNFLGAGNDLVGELALEDQIQRYSKFIYSGDCIGMKKKDLESHDQGWQPTTLYDAWRLRQLDPYSLSEISGGDDHIKIRRRSDSTEHKRWAAVQTRVLSELKPFIGTNAAYHLVKHYWYSQNVRNRGNSTVTVEMKNQKIQWLQICRDVQVKLLNIVRERQLVVEVNPSSNRVVGPMDKMDDHPVFRLTLDKDNHLAIDSRVTINTDDPGVFATSLTHEFYLLGEILVNRGVPETEVVKWLEWLRKNGEDYSFLRNHPNASDTRMKEVLDYLLDRYQILLRRLKGLRRQYLPPDTGRYSYNAGKNDYERLKEKYRRLEIRLRKLEKNTKKK
jgi:hypothetical protein